MTGDGISTGAVLFTVGTFFIILLLLLAAGQLIREGNDDG
jgi:hypothetical protein